MIVLKLYQGDNRIWELTVTDENDAAVDITGSTIVMSLKNSKDETGYVIQKPFTLTDPTNGLAEVEFVPTDTSGLSVAAEGNEYVFDVKITTAAVKDYTLLEGKFKLYKGVT